MTRKRSNVVGGAATSTSDAASTPAKSSSIASCYAMAPEADVPPQLVILPSTVTSEARIYTWRNPRHAKPTRYLVCPETGIYEFTKMAAPRSSPRSWLIEGESGAKREKGSSVNEWRKDEDGEGVQGGNDQFPAHITEDADLYVASPYDPLFLLLPALATIKASSENFENPVKRLFLSSGDYFDALVELQPDTHLYDALRSAPLKSIFEARMASVCDTVDGPDDDHMFRLNESRLLDELLSKAKRMSEGGLPQSMEEKFVKKALEAPILGVRSQPDVRSQNESRGTRSGAETATECSESQTSVPTANTPTSSVLDASTGAMSVSDLSTTELLTSAMTPSPAVVDLQRLRVAFQFICSSYLPPALTETLRTRLASSTSTDFKPLAEYLDRLAKVKQEAAAARASDYSRKRILNEEENDVRVEKRRKKEDDEERRKVGQTRGLRKLQKVDTKGMMKLSEFFKK